MKILLTEKEVAVEYGISVNTLRTWRQDRSKLPFQKIGRLVRYRRDDIENYVKKNTVEVIQ